MFPTFAYAQSSSDENAIRALILLMVLFITYFTPGMVASYRKHHNEYAIIALNTFLGWTLLGWLVALIWAFTNPASANQAPAVSPQPADPPPSSSTFVCPHCGQVLHNRVETCPRCRNELTPGQSDQPVVPAASNDISERLSKLESLKTQRLISEAEYNEKRAAILDEL